MKNVVITILSVLVLGFGCFIIYDKVINKEEKKENSVVDNVKGSEGENNNSAIEEKDFDLVEAKKLIDKFYGGQLFNFFYNGYNESTKSHFAATFIKAEELDMLNISNLDAFECSDNVSIQTNHTYSCKLKNSSLYTALIPNKVSYNDMNASYKRLYGNDQNISKGSISIDSGRRYIYINEIDSFIEASIYGGGDGSFVGAQVYGVKSAKLSGNKLVIDVGYGFYGPKSNGVVLEIANGEEITLTDSETENTEALVNKYLDRLTTYEFEFLYEDGLYKLRNVTKK